MTAVPLGGVLLEGVEHLSVVAELTDEAFLSTQAAAENMGAGKLDHFGQEGGQFSINHLTGEERKDGHFGENTHTFVNPAVVGGYLSNIVTWSYKSCATCCVISKQKAFHTNELHH